MPGVCSRKQAGGDFKNPEPQRYEHVGMIVGADLLVDGLQDFCRVMVPVFGHVVDDDFGSHHEHGRGDALSGYVGNNQRQMVPVDHLEIKEVAPELLGRFRPGVDVELLPLREDGIRVGQHIALDGFGQFQFHAQTLGFLCFGFLLHDDGAVAFDACRENGSGGEQQKEYRDENGRHGSARNRKHIQQRKQQEKQIQHRCRKHHSRGNQAGADFTVQVIAGLLLRL